jgi:hypothetical protein
VTAHQTRDARAISMRAFDHAIRLDQGYFGAEHFLLALAAADQPAGAALRELGVTPERVAAEIARVGLLGELDRDALAAIGVDIEAVYAKAESAFGRAALARAAAAQTGSRESAWFRINPRRRAGAARDGVFLPHDAGGLQVIRNARQEAQTRRAGQFDVELLALGVVAVTEGAVPAILAGLGVSGPTARAAIMDRYRQAS